ncbi:NADH(P)-binding-domain-containing protein [Trametes elegans]|nr:NADH(P)-binding-domain-containing protein [Trametes elegans]
MSKKVVIVGGHGKVSLRLSRLIGPSNDVTSIIRNPAQADDITAASAKPLVLSVEDAPVADFTKAFQGTDVVYWSCGAGGKGGEEGTKKIDYEGALKVYDAIEAVDGPKPRLIVVSAVDIRDPDTVPAHYNDADRTVSERIRQALPAYMKWKYEADKDLVRRTAFKWFILRAGGLSDGPATGKADVGRTHITQVISRDDVAKVLALLLDRPDADGLALDVVGGEAPIEGALDAAIKKGETDWLG